MSRTTAIVSLLLSASLLAGAAVNAAEDAELEAVRARITEMFAAIDAENVSRSPVDGWYTVHKGSIVAYVSADGRYLLQGDLIDLDLEVNLSEQTRNLTRRELMASLDDSSTIVFSPETVKHRVTIFTDIDCGYCRKLHNEIDGYLEAGIEVRYLLYPRNGPASGSWRTSESVWCAKDRNQALTAAKQDREFDSQKCDASIISEHYLLGQSIGLTGTPAIVLDDGTLLSGYMPPARLSSRLVQMVQQAQAH